MGIPNNRFIIIERREKVLILLSQGLTETEISKQLNIHQSTVCRDIRMIKKQSQQILESINQEILPYELERCLTTIEQLIKEGWTIFQDVSEKWTNKDKINALKLIKESIRTKLEILLQGPATIHLQQLDVRVKELIQKIDTDEIESKPKDLLLHSQNSGI